MEQSAECRRAVIAVAAHREYGMPEDRLYQPVFVGAALSPDRSVPERLAAENGWALDDSGDNISDLNKSFCELTALYWVWKNLRAGTAGLAHYRRHFGKPDGAGARRGKDAPLSERVLTEAELLPLLDRFDVIVPKERNYYIETLYSHYAHTHEARHLDVTREIIAEGCPDYLDSFDGVMRRRRGYMFNMMIAERGIFDAYCGWLFGILFELRERFGTGDGASVPGAGDGASAFSARFYGRVSELLWNVWLAQAEKEKRVARERVLELPCVYTEPVNWVKKGSAFLGAKFLGKKYEHSF